MGRLIAQTGFAGSVGGTVTVYGTTGAQTVTVLDVPGDVTFDASFNRGGNVIVFTKAASEYQIVRSGSSVVISDNDSRIAIPIGAVANTLQFTDGDRALRFDGGIKVGDQLVDATAKTIAAAGSEKSALPQDTSASASRLVLSNETVSVGGKINVFGSVGSETVNVVGLANTITFDASFNRGGDKVNLNNLPETYTAKMSGSTAVLSDGNTTVNVPIGAKGLRVGFSNEERTLIYGNGSAYLGNQTIKQNFENVVTYESNLKFIEMPLPFKGVLPYGNTTFGPLPDAIDINGDGYKDLVFLFQENKYLWSRGTVDPDGPANSQVRIFINNNGENFVDKTNYFIKDNYIDGQATRSTVYDINNDGRLDIIYPVSREDGRSTANQYHATTRFKILLSGIDGNYQIVEIGQKDWYNDSEVFLVDNVMQFAVSGYRPETYTNPQEFFKFENGQIIKSDFRILEENGSYLHSLGWGFHFYDRFEGSLNVNTLFNPTSKTLDSGATVRGFNVYARGADSVWRYVDDFYNVKGTFVKNIEFIGWNGEPYSTEVFDLGSGIYGIRPGIYGATASIKLYPNAAPVFIAVQSDTVIFSDDIGSVTSVKEGVPVTYGRVIAIDFDGSNLNYSEIKIKGLDPYELAAEVMEARDINKDGYDDIILYTWQKSAINSLFINNKDGTFYRFDVDYLSKDIRYDSIYDDFNNDGNFDIISMIADGQWESVNPDMSGFLYYQSSAGIIS